MDEKEKIEEEIEGIEKEIEKIEEKIEEKKKEKEEIEEKGGNTEKIQKEIEELSERKKKGRKKEEEWRGRKRREERKKIYDAMVAALMGDDKTMCAQILEEIDQIQDGVVEPWLGAKGESIKHFEKGLLDVVMKKKDEKLRKKALELLVWIACPAGIPIAQKILFDEKETAEIRKVAAKFLSFVAERRNLGNENRNTAIDALSRFAADEKMNIEVRKYVIGEIFYLSEKYTN